MTDIVQALFSKTEKGIKLRNDRETDEEGRVAITCDRVASV